MHNAAYGRYLRSAKWKKVRKQAMERAGYRCQVCNGTESLHVHHRTYERLGREHPMDLTVLCRVCHKIFHRRRGLKGKAPSGAPDLVVYDISEADELDSEFDARIAR